MKTLQIILLTLLPLAIWSQGEADVHQNPEKLIRYLYSQVTIEPNHPPHWEKVRPLFLKEALVAMRFKKDSSAVFTVDQWIGDFDRFIDQREILKTGFQETILSIEVLEFGNIAQATVVYESKIPGVNDGHPGLDCFHLVFIDGKWKIVSLVNEVPGKNRPMPEGL